MPAIAVAFDTTYGTVQSVLTVYLFGFAGAQLVYGPLSDRFGRRPVLLVGLLLYIAGTLTCLFAPIVEVMIAGRLVQAIGGCSGMIMARAIVRDVYDREGSATTLASVLTAAALGPMVAPLIGGYLQAWFGWQANFMVLLAAGIGILIACWFLLNETLGERRPMASPIDMVLDFAKLMRFPSFWGYTCQPAFNAAVFFAFVGGAPYVLVEILGRPPQEFGLYMLSVPGMFVAGNFACRRLTPLIGSERMIQLACVGSLIGVAGLAALLWTNYLETWALFAPMSWIALINGFSQANSVSGVISIDPSRAGAAAGLSGFLHVTMGAMAALIVGNLLSDSATPMLLLMIGLTILSPVAYILGVLVFGQPTR